MQVLISSIYESSRLYCTWQHRNSLPLEVKRNFGDLDNFIKQLLSSANESITIIVPYLTKEGISLIKESILLGINNGAWCKIILGNPNDKSGFTKNAIDELVSGESGKIIHKRLRILKGSKSLSVLLHSKVIVIDSSKGYLGSANLSYSAIEVNFEIGVSLSGKQATSLDELIKYWESTGMLTEIVAN